MLTETPTRLLELGLPQGTDLFFLSFYAMNPDLRRQPRRVNLVYRLLLSAPAA